MAPDGYAESFNTSENCEPTTGVPVPGACFAAFAHGAASSNARPLTLPTGQLS